MKKFLLTALCAFLTTFSLIGYAQSVITTNSVFIKVTSTNSVSSWVQSNIDYTGVGVAVTSGSCMAEISLEVFTACTNNTATPFNLFPASVTSASSAFKNVSGTSCVRLNCTAGTGAMFVRRH